MHEKDSAHFDPAESLRIIRETIDLARRDLSDDGFHFLLWGALLSVAGACHYWLNDVAGVSWSPLIWIAPVALGVPAAFVYEYGRKKRKPAYNIVRRWYGMVWLGFFVTLGLLIFWSQRYGLSPTPMILAATGFAVFVSGQLLRFQPLVYGAALIWAGSLVCTWTTGAQDSLVFSLVIAVGYLIPGGLLRKQSRKSYVSGA